MRALHTAARHRARHLVFGAGGTRAFLNGAGSMFACYLAGVNTWDSIGGVSGGSIPALLTAGGVHPREIVRHAVNTDFSELLVQHDSFGNMVKQRLFGRKTARRLLRNGIVKSEGLGSYLETVVPEWPEKFWTMAVAGKNILLFTKQGVFLYRRGRRRQLTHTPPPISLAIRASCAVPGIIEAIQYGDHVLFDGALTKYGHCPTEMAMMHFGAEIDDIVAVDLVRHRGSRQERVLETLARLLSGTLRQRPRLPIPRAGLLVRTNMDDFPSLDFSVATEQKQSAILAGFRTACNELFVSEQIDQQQLHDLLSQSEDWSAFELLLKSTEEKAEVVTPVEEPVVVHRRRWWQFWRR